MQYQWFVFWSGLFDWLIFSVSLFVIAYNFNKLLGSHIDISVIETLSNPQQSWGESCTQVAITKATEKNSVVYYVRV